MNAFQVIGGEHFPEAIANACISEANLTPKDLVVLDAYFEQLYMLAARVHHQEIAAEFGIPLDVLLPYYYGKITNIPIGWDWLQNKLELLPPTDQRHVVITSVLATGKSPKCSISLLEIAGNA